MSRQNIGIKGSKHVKSIQKILNSEGDQKLKVVESEDIESTRIKGKRKTPSLTLHKNMRNYFSYNRRHSPACLNRRYPQ